jgi:hypothetical protein
MDTPLAIVFVQAQSVPGGNDSIWIDLTAPVLSAPDGRRAAMGAVRVHLAGGDVLVYRPLSADAAFDGESLVGVMVELERVNDDGAANGETAILFVRPDPDVAECLIYDLLGADVRLTGEAMGRFSWHFILRRPPRT